MVARNYDDRYAKFRREVRKRDKGKCQYPLCRCRTRLQVHHISRWVDNSEMRYEPSNGILLCKAHHKYVTGKEHFYADLFREIVERNNGK